MPRAYLLGMSKQLVTRSVRTLCLLLLSAPGWSRLGFPQNIKEAEQAQPPVTTLKVTSRVVAISAVVKAKDGEPRAGLSKDDFVLKQDGREEPIRYFSQGSALPLTLALMVDTSGSQRTFIGDESLASDVFLETMLGRPEDQAMLVQFDYRVLALKGMTSSANELHLALSMLSSRASSIGGTLLNDAVYTVARDYLASKSGRKAMIILTDGGDNGSRRTLAEAIEQAQRADVQVYSILYSMWDSMNDTRPGPTGPKDPGLSVLQALSESTGGRVFTVARNMGLRAIFAQIGEDLRLQYELGYTPPPDTLANSYHRLELKAKDKKLSVQARKGFFAQP